MFQSQRFAALLIDRVMSGTALPDAMEALAFDRQPAAAKSFIMELTLGTLRQWGLCSSLADSLAARHISPMSLQALLSVALFQLMFMKQPPFAVVDQAVKAAGIDNSYAKNFANALLRRFLREKDAALAKVRDRPLAKFSFPRWWIDRVQAAFPDDYAAMLLAQNVPPPITLRVNRQKCDRARYLDLLKNAGIAAQPIGETGVMLDTATDVPSLPFFADGYFSVQDAAAQHAARLLDVKEGQRVLDAAAAPGGKATHILETARVHVTAVDCDRKRMTVMKENVARLGLDRTAPPIAYRIADAENVSQWWDGKPFDRVLLDAPCSASGVARRHPDAKWLKRHTDLPALAAKQLSLLTALWKTLSPNGILLYATCSVFPTENEEVIAAFVARHKDATRQHLDFPDDVPRVGGQLLPVAGQSYNQDGLFYAALVKA